MRHLKAEMSSREAVNDRAVGEAATRVADAGVETDAPRNGDGGMAVEGLTIVVHMLGKDDLVVNTDLRGVGACVES